MLILSVFLLMVLSDYLRKACITGFVVAKYLQYLSVKYVSYVSAQTDIVGCIIRSLSYLKRDNHFLILNIYCSFIWFL